MKRTSLLFSGIILLIIISCGGGNSGNKAASDSGDAAMSLAKDVCSCITEISAPKSDTMAYKLAVNSCVVEGMAASRNVENVGMNELLEAIKEACPEGYAVYQQ